MHVIALASMRIAVKPGTVTKSGSVYRGSPGCTFQKSDKRKGSYARRSCRLMLKPDQWDTGTLCLSGWYRKRSQDFLSRHICGVLTSIRSMCPPNWCSSRLFVPADFASFWHSQSNCHKMLFSFSALFRTWSDYWGL
jgi:hypothetical protein